MDRYNELRKKKKNIDRHNLIFCSTSYHQKINELKAVENSRLHNEDNVIKQLLRHPYKKFSFMDKRTFINNGRPTPDIELVGSNDHGKFIVDEKVYHAIPWVCGNQSTNRLFCWPCLLFSDEQTIWNSIGISSFEKFTATEKQHSSSLQHILALKEFKLFGKDRYIDLVLKDDFRTISNKHNNVVRQNRMILKQLITILCNLSSHESNVICNSPNNDLANENNTIHNERYYKVINILKHYNNDFYVDAQQQKNVINVYSSNLYNDLVFSIAEVVLQEIKKEISETSFVSLSFYEISKPNLKNHILSTARYTNMDGNVVDRFLNLSISEPVQTSSHMFQHLNKIVDDFKIGAKLVAYTYDGALLQISEHNQFEMNVQENYPYAVFMNAYSDNCKSIGDKSCSLNAILIQSMCKIKPVRLFFSMLKKVGEFFVTSNKCLEILKPLRFVSVAPSSKEFHTESILVEILFENKEQFKDALATVLSHTNKWDLDTISSAYNLAAWFLTFDFNFFLAIFYLILPATQKLFSIMQRNTQSNINISVIERKLNVLQHFLSKLMDDFDTIWRTIYKNYKISAEGMFQMKTPNTPGGDSQNDFHVPPMSKKAYRGILNEIMKTIQFNLNSRFSDILKFTFLELLDPKKFEQYKTKFPDSTFLALKETYGACFEFDNLKNELNVIYNDRKIIKNLSPFKLLKYIKKLDLVSIFPELFKFCQLILTMPIINVTLNDSAEKFTALDRVNNYINSQTNSFCSLFPISNAILHIENSYIESLRWKYKETFNELVIQTLLKRDNKVELTYST